MQHLHQVLTGQCCCCCLLDFGAEVFLRPMLLLLQL
jgi:hypothetical protein